jgi:polar amino acid transport system substrate-binding protein
MQNSYCEDKRLVIVGEEFPPFEFVQNKKVVGIDIDISSQIFNKMNIPVEYHIMPWSRAWVMIERGAADAVFSTSRKNHREPFVIFPNENMWESQFVFFVRKDKYDPNFNGYQTAIDKHLKIGIIRGNSYHSSFWKAFPCKNGAVCFQGEISDSSILNSQLDLGSNVETNLKKLIGGRFDLFPCDKIMGMYAAKLFGFHNKITFYEKVLFSKGYPMAFAKKSSFTNINVIADQFEKELVNLKKIGNYQKILDNWLK